MRKMREDFDAMVREMSKEMKGEIVHAGRS